MSGQAGSGPGGLSRRRVLGGAAAAVGLWADAGGRRSWGASPSRRLAADDDPGWLSPFERVHVPGLRIPVVTANGAKVPVVVEMAHPMEPGHYVTAIQVANERDPVSSKGVFHFTPANGQAYLAFQARVDEGISEVAVTAECNLHGRWSSTRAINIAEGAGGCAAPVPPHGPAAGADTRPPRNRIPEPVRHRRIRAAEIIDVQLSTRHPSRTGLAGRNGKFLRIADPFYLQEMEVFYGTERVSRFAMTSALSDDPLITFRLRAAHEGPLRILLVNSRGQLFEATHPIRLT